MADSPLLSNDSENKDTEQSLPEIYDALEELAAAKDNAGKLVKESTTLYELLKKPRDQLARNIQQLEKLQQTCRILRDIKQFYTLTQKLHDDDKSINEADYAALVSIAKMIKQIDTVASRLHLLNGIEAVEREKHRVNTIRELISNKGEQLVNQALVDQDSLQLSRALVIYYHLGKMEDYIDTFVDTRIRQLADTAIELTNTTSPSTTNNSNNRIDPEYATIFWTKLSTWIDSVYKTGCDLYELQSALNHQQSQLNLESSIDNNLLDIYWKKLANLVKTKLLSSGTVSKSVHAHTMELLYSDYPRWLRLWHDLFAKLSSYFGETFDAEHPEPQVSLIIGSMSQLEATYIRRWQRQLDDQMRKSFSQRGGISRDELSRIGSLLVAELERLQFDPRTTRLIIQSANDVVIQCVERGRLLLRSPANFEIGQGICTPGQLLNIDIANAMHALLTYLNHSDAYAKYISHERASSKSLAQLITSVIDPMLKAFEKALVETLLKMHNEFNNKTDGSQSPVSTSGGSDYMDEFSRKIGYLQREYLARFECDSVLVPRVQQWIDRLLRVFMLQASIICPLDEHKRLCLAADATQLEFCTNNIATSGRVTWSLSDLGSSYAALRSFRHLLFATSDEIVTRTDLQVISPLVRVHQLLLHVYKEIGSPYQLLDTSLDSYMHQLNELVMDNDHVMVH
ncbi:hypothetical protein BDF22DRAFT_744050 [Syncephalis plumigaleata]|nr:hypothetical protein BDF22DRAFT_744050 [Syncephalis plumigaleata]